MLNPKHKLLSKDTKAKLPFSIGVNKYINASTNGYYVDKTLLIKNVLDTNTSVFLFTRPRRFGKSLNMDMLKIFFEKTNKDTSIYFKDKKIWNCGKKYQEHQGKYPVIYLTFKDIKSTTWSSIYEEIRLLIQKEFSRHNELLTSSKLTSVQQTDIQKIISLTASQALEQIEEKQYDTVMKQRDVMQVYKYGIAFSGKNVAIKKL